MKEYKVVYLNRKATMSHEKDAATTEETINQYASEGWELQQVVSPSNGWGAMYGVFVKEKKL